MDTKTIRIAGMHCDGCASRIKRGLEREAGVREAEVLHPAGEAGVQYDEHTVSTDRLRELIERAGYTAGEVE